MKGHALAVIAVLTGCTERSATISLADLDGTYVSAPCPDLEIESGQIVFGDKKIPGRLINIKGDNLLATDQALRFTESSGSCSLTIALDPVYHSILVEAGQVSIEISSADRTMSRRWVRISNSLEKSSL